MSEGQKHARLCLVGLAVGAMGLLGACRSAGVNPSDASGRGPGTSTMVVLGKVVSVGEEDEATDAGVAISLSFSPERCGFVFGDVAVVSGEVQRDGEVVEFASRPEVTVDWLEGTVDLVGVSLPRGTRSIALLEVLLAGFEVREWDSVDFGCAVPGEEEVEEVSGIELKAVVRGRACDVTVRLSGDDRVRGPADLRSHEEIATLAVVEDRDGDPLDVFSSVSRSNVTAAQFRRAGNEEIKLPVRVRVRWPRSVRVGVTCVRASDVRVRSGEVE